MHLYNLEINRIAIHQIYQRESSGDKKTPKKGSQLILFGESALETFRQRVVEALGLNSKAVNMVIESEDAKRVPSLVNQLDNVDDDTFLDISYEIADNLAEAQKKKRLPGGIVVVFEGTFGSQANKTLIGIMKAEIYSAYQKVEDEKTHEISLDYIEEALLTPSTRLFKTAGFTKAKSQHAAQNQSEDEDLNAVWEVYVSDYQINKADGKAAAKYFYADFLGCGYPKSKARTTKQFYDATCQFIDSLDCSPTEKNDYRNALVTYLKVENNETVSGADFSSRYFKDSETQDKYAIHLRENKLPSTSFIKDNEYILSKLRYRKLSFSKNIKITAPSETFKDLVTIETISKDPDGEPVNWTRILIKDKIVTQE